MTDQTALGQLEQRTVKVDDLLFDDENPRLSEDGGSRSQGSLLLTLWRDYSVDEVALSIAENGYLDYEPIFAEERGSQLVVIEGNRRLAAVKLLRSAGLRSEVGATDLPRITKSEVAALEELPVVVCKRDKVWQYIGYKHVNGPQNWSSYAKAEYIAWVHNNLGVSLEEVARRIGDQHSTVDRLYRALMVIQQAETKGKWAREDRFRKHFSFSHLYTGLNYTGISNYIQVRDVTENRKTYVPASHEPQLGRLCVWLYGSKARDVAPLIDSQNPDLRILDDALQSADGIAALENGLPLRTARDVGRGDNALLRQFLVSARQNLIDARGRIVTGYEGESDLLKSAAEIVELSEAIHDDMERLRQRRSASKSAPGKRTVKKAATRRRGE